MSGENDESAGDRGNDSWDEKFRTYLVEDLISELMKVSPYVQDELNKRVVSEPLNLAIEALARMLTSSVVIGKKRVKALCTGLLCHSDLYMLSLRKICSSISALTAVQQYWNVFYYLKFIPVPNKKLQTLFFETEVPIKFAKAGPKNAMARRQYQNAWLEFLKHELPSTLLKELIPYFCASALSAMREGYLFGDFLFRAFKMGDIFAVISLDGIYKLITEHNFECPEFYACVYKLTIPSICYMSYRQKFFTLVDMFLSSTHLPTYIVAAFVKRLCRLTLTAPLACQEPLLSLVRNLMTRHEGVRPLLHRDNPDTVDSDPYNELEDDLQKCRAIESSIWEIKTIQRHWYLDIAKRANFVDRGVQRMESFVRWKTDDDYFSQMMSKKFGADLLKHADELSFQKNQSKFSDNEDDIDEEEPNKKRKRKGKISLNNKQEFSVPINHREPLTDFIPENFQFSFGDFWKF